MSVGSVSVTVYNAACLVATTGVARGEPISFADELLLDDVYQLASGSAACNLDLLSRPRDAAFDRADRPGHLVHIDCCLTLMSPDGGTTEALIVVEVAKTGVAEVFVLPLAPLVPQVAYRLVGIERHIATQRFAQAGCGAFAAGTRITRADGQLCPIENLRRGDMIRTRDAGRQPLRWIGKTTLRAIGTFAPVVIRAGTLHNAADLVVRADHRLFIYQRTDAVGAGRAEVLIRARHLVNDTTVYRRTGGFIDYYQLVFDSHHIIYAEGISAESQRVDAATRPALPNGVPLPDHPPGRLGEYEVAATLVAPATAAALLHRATT